MWTDRARRALWADFFGQQAAWWWCVLWARTGYARAALVGPALYAAGHLGARPGARWLVAVLGSAGAVLGFSGDTLLLRLGLLSFSVPGASARWSPPFMVALWAMFALSCSASAASLVRLGAAPRAGLAALIGPLAYLGGERLGLLSLADGAVAAVALEWALLVTLLALGARPLLRTGPEVAA